MKTVKWGLIGAGDIARKRIALALRDLANGEFVSVSRRKSDEAESFAREFGARKWYSDWREQIADIEIDAVYIATPVYLHMEQTIAAADAGKHVLCEKPMALNAADCDRMIAACAANDVKLGISYYRRFYPVLSRAKAIIAAGEIGNVTLAQANTFELVQIADDNSRHWFLEKEKSGGGPMMDFGCHRIELLIDLLGPITRVSNLVSNEAFRRDVEDTAVANLQFEGGACASVSVTHAAFEPKDTLDIYGTKGSIHIPVLNAGDMTVRAAAGERLESHPPAGNIHSPLIEDFTHAVLEDREPAVGGDAGREVQRVIDKIYGQEKLTI